MRDKKPNWTFHSKILVTTMWLHLAKGAVTRQKHRWFDWMGWGRRGGSASVRRKKCSEENLRYATRVQLLWVSPNGMTKRDNDCANNAKYIEFPLHYHLPSLPPPLLHASYIQPPYLSLSLSLSHIGSNHLLHLVPPPPSAIRRGGRWMQDKAGFN